MKEKIIYLGLLCAIGVSIIIFLHSVNVKRSDRPTHFTRRFIANPVRLINSIDVKYNSYYVAGAADNQIYLGNRTAPMYILAIDPSLLHCDQLIISNATGKKISSGHITIDSPYYYLHDEVTRSLFRGDLPIGKLDHYQNTGVFADLIIPIGRDRFVIRTIKSKTLLYSLAIESDSAKILSPESNPLVKQVDGIFSCVGSINYDPVKGRLIYLYMYRNQFIVMDSNLHPLYKGITIDTTTWAKIKIASINSQHAITLSETPLVVNKASFVYRGCLLINAGLKADNEKPDDFEKASVFDVYDSDKGFYKFSFYLPDYKNKKISCFGIFYNQLFAVSDHYLLSYAMDTKQFE